MNNATNEPSDFDKDIAAAFEPLASATTPDLWNRIETAALGTEGDGAEASWRRRRPMLAAAAVLLVVLGGFAAIKTLGTDDPVDVIDLVPTTTSSTTPVTTSPTTVPVTTAVPATPLLENATWVRLDLQTNALVSDTGESFAVDNVPFGGGQAVQRLPDGTVAVATRDGVLLFDPSVLLPAVLYEGAASALGVSDSGQLIAATDEGPLNLTTGEPEAQMPADGRQVIVGQNGFSVEVIPGQYETALGGEIEGEVSRVIAPDALRLLFEGDQNDVWNLGGPAEYRVVLDDFNGRYLLAHRRPDEPALPPSVHVVIDIFGGTSESFVAIPGTVALALPTTNERPSVFSTGGLQLCPTMSGSVLLNSPGELNSTASAAFDQTALGVARCDETWLRQVHADGQWDDNVWQQISASLGSVPRRTESGWVFGQDSAAPVSIGDDGEVQVNSTAGVFELQVIRWDRYVVLAGSVGPETATGLRAAATSVVGAENVVDFGLSETGAEMKSDLRIGVEGMIGLGFRRSPIVEALVTPTLIRVISQDDFVTDGEQTAPALERAGVEIQAQLLSVEPTNAERSIVEALQTFAAGGSLAQNIPWAAEVVIGAGPIQGQRLSPDDMFTRSNWLIENAPFFRAGGEDAFTALRAVPNPSMIGGPHNHCASPPVPAPTALAGLRRVSIQPAPDSIDSCLQWITFDVFFDNDGRVAGVTVDWWEP